MELNRKEIIDPANHPFLELLAFIFIWLCCALLGSLVVSFFMQGSNWSSLVALLDQIKVTKDGDLINRLRYVQIIGHLSNYLLPSLIFIFLWHRQHSLKNMQLNQAPTFQGVFINLAAIIVLFPFISWVYYWNMVLLPEDWIGQDKLALQAAFLNMRNEYELLLNILLLGVLAALGEELVFRGIIQRIIEHWSGNVHWSAIITALLFSFIHFQWEGFVARFILGLLFGYLLIYTKNLWIPILMHFFFNSIQVVIPYFNQKAMQKVGEVTQVPLLTAIGSFLAFVLIFKFLVVGKK